MMEKSLANELGLHHEQLVRWSIWPALPSPASILFILLSHCPFCSVLGKGFPLLMPFLDMCLHRAGNLISTFPAGECPVTSVKHFRLAETSLPNQQALTPFKQSDGRVCFYREFLSFWAGLLWWVERWLPTYTTPRPRCLKRLSKKDLRESIQSGEQGKQWV